MPLCMLLWVVLCRFIIDRLANTKTRTLIVLLSLLVVVLLLLRFFKKESRERKKMFLVA